MDKKLENKLKELEIQTDCTQKTQEFLEWYYFEYINSQSVLDCVQSDLEYEEIAYPEELTMPMDIRPSGIYEAMEWIVSHGWDINTSSRWSPLMISVSWCDAPMTEFLLQNGADANIWPDMENGDQNYYLDDLNIAYLNESWNRKDHAFVDALLNTAKILVTIGGLGDYHGICLSIDTKSHIISVDGPHYNF